MTHERAGSPILLEKDGKMTTSPTVLELDILPPDYTSPSDVSTTEGPPIEELLVVASHEDIPDREFGNLMTAPVPVQEVLAQNPNLRDPFLSALIVVSDATQAALLAENPGLDEQHIRMLYGRHSELLPALLKHPNAPEDLKETVFFKPHPGENPFLP